MELLINYVELDIFLFRIKNNGRQWDIVTFYELKKDSWNWGNKFWGNKIKARDKVSYQIRYKLGYEI